MNKISECHFRFTYIAIILLLSISLTGCVFSRLLTVKNRLKNIDRHYDIKEEHGLTFVFKQPVLTSSDVTWLMSSEPTARTANGDHEIWIYDFERGDGYDSPQVTIQAHIKQGMLYKLIYPSFILDVVDIDFFKTALTAMGNGGVNHFKKTITGRWRSNHAGLNKQIPAREKIESVLGKPSATFERATEVETHYNYHLIKLDHSGAVTSQIIFKFNKNGKMFKMASMFNGMGSALYFPK